jgi:hypothetical protein
VVDLVNHCEFDTIYHQRLCYFSVPALDHLFRRHGLYLNKVQQTAIRGGSLRLFVENREDVRPGVERLLAAERPDTRFLREFGSLLVQTRKGASSSMLPTKSCSSWWRRSWRMAWFSPLWYQ